MGFIFLVSVTLGCHIAFIGLFQPLFDIPSSYCALVVLQSVLVCPITFQRAAVATGPLLEPPLKRLPGVLILYDYSKPEVGCNIVQLKER